VVDFQLFELVGIEEQDFGPESFIGKGAAYFADTSLCWFTVSIEYRVEDDELYFSLDCDGPHPGHWLSCELDNTSLAEMLVGHNTAYEDHKETIDWMMREGIAPGQMFMIEAWYNCYQDHWGDWDCEVDYRIMDREPMTAKQSVEAWLTYFQERRASHWAHMGTLVPVRVDE
jgi:hypothetical protein